MKRLLYAIIGALALSYAPINGAAVLSPPPDLNLDVLSLALRAVECAKSSGMLKSFNYLAVIDYSLPSSLPRLWVFDVRTGQLIFHELVAHGRNSGSAVAHTFSNVNGSKMSSLGLFATTDTYFGNNGYSLRLRGLDKGFNDKALERAIVMHGSDYVNWAVAAQRGMVGRSWGCPAVPKDIARVMIDTLKNGSLIFAYYPDPAWLTSSPMLNCKI